MRYSLVALLLLALNSTVFAQTTVPFTFTSGTAAKASEVNADFQALATAIDALSARINKLDGTTPVTTADLAGTYTLTGWMSQVFIDGMSVLPAPLYDINGFGVLSGTVTLNADGTGSNSFTINGSQMVTQDISTIRTTSPISLNRAVIQKAFNVVLPTASFTWTLSGNVVTTSHGMSMRAQPGAKVLAGAQNDFASDTHIIFIITK